jgi:hypothetical protein
VTNALALLRLLPMSDRDKDTEILVAVLSALTCLAWLGWDREHQADLAPGAAPGLGAATAMVSGVVIGIRDRRGHTPQGP